MFKKKKDLKQNNLNLNLKELEKVEQTKLKISKGKEIMKIRTEINEIVYRKTIEKINKTKSWFSDCGFSYPSKLRKYMCQ